MNKTYAVGTQESCFNESILDIWLADGKDNHYNLGLSQPMNFIFNRNGVIQIYFKRCGSSLGAETQAPR